MLNGLSHYKRKPPRKLQKALDTPPHCNGPFARCVSRAHWTLKGEGPVRNLNPEDHIRASGLRVELSNPAAGMAVSQARPVGALVLTAVALAFFLIVIFEALQ
jgi:hypothetical protein